jgi:hypothetical protein
VIHKQRNLHGYLRRSDHAESSRLWKRLRVAQGEKAGREALADLRGFIAARNAAALVSLDEAGAPEICLKDMAGIGRPGMLGQLVRTIKEKHPDILIQYHGHSGPGLSMASILEVCENGADIIDVAMEPMSWGKVHPDVISVQAILIFFFHFVNYLTRMKNILHHGIVLHQKAQGKQHRWRCMG